MAVGTGDVVWEVLSFVGLALMLGAFLLHGLGRLPHGPAYFSMNVVGGAVLAAYSAVLGSVALMLLEGAWAVAAAVAWVAWSGGRAQARRGGRE
jgi:hypothetical protein